MNEVEIDSIRRSLPASWNELTKDQLIFVTRMFHKSMTVGDFKVHTLFEFLSIKMNIFKRIASEDAFFLCKALDFILAEVTLTKNLTPFIRRGLTKYYGTSDGLLYCTFGEFTRAHTQFEQFVDTKDESALTELVAILYRKKKFGWFIRKHFTDSPDPRVRLKNRTLKRRIKRFEKIDHMIKYSVFLFFFGCINSFPRQFPNVFRKKEDSGTSANGWISLIISLADGKTDNRSIDLVVNSNLYNVFLGLEQKSIEYFEYLDKIGRK